MASHNATGRNKHPSKAERQVALGKAMIKNPTPTPTDTKAAPPTDTKPEPANNIVPISKGAATRARWAVCLKARPGATLVMAADIKALSLDSVITALVEGNPKKRGSEPRYRLYGFNGKKGATTTIGGYLKAMERHGNTLAYADMAWDVNHGFIEITEVQSVAPEAEPEPVEEPVPETYPDTGKIEPGSLLEQEYDEKLAALSEPEPDADSEAA